MTQKFDEYDYIDFLGEYDDNNIDFISMPENEHVYDIEVL